MDDKKKNKEITIFKVCDNLKILYSNWNHENKAKKTERE